jgi:hypothetical protein
MEGLDKFLKIYSNRLPKGYPDLSKLEDITILESLLSDVLGEGVYSVLNEKALAWMDLSSESRKHHRLSIIADKIKNGDPFTLETGEDSKLILSDSSYKVLFQNQDISKIKEAGGVKINKFPFFKDALQKVNGIEMPLIFTNKPGGKMAKSRLGSTPKPRGSIII